jgi:hypothetical protein
MPRWCPPPANAGLAVEAVKIGGLGIDDSSREQVPDMCGLTPVKPA